ncbi:MAG: hypothetical protein U0228_07715 [Myxococcaceae bacterium]
MRALKAVAKVLLGILLGLVVAEGVFRLRDQSAFPHLNYYEPDDQLGVRLRPHASMQLRVATGNPITTAATNADGFRGAEWPAPRGPGADEVLVVGDSQVFGLGVEAEQTFSAKLGPALGGDVVVLNAGVPTYGPAEYTEVVRRQLEARQRVKTVVFVMNLANDLFELDRPNVERHRVWDGWAVRTETAPRDVTSFPFRGTLMSQSHLVYAARGLLHAASPGNEGFATEGSWKDVASAGEKVTPLPPADEAARTLLVQRRDLSRQLEELAQNLQSHLEEQLGDNKYVDELKPLVPQGGDPRDILEVPFAEGARRVDVTAYHLFMAAVGQARNDKLLEELATKKKDGKLKDLLEQRRALRFKLDSLRPADEAPNALPLDLMLGKVQALCAAAGARLVVVALPLDVMVSGEEWKKYGVEKPLDLSATRVLTEDLVARAERAGAVGVDPTAALAAAEPGAFLNGDLHLTPKGHEVLAKEIAAAVLRPAKPKVSALTLPEGRSWPPGEDEFRRADECVVKGSTAAGCETKLVREWLRVSCETRAGDEGEYARTVEVLEGGHGDSRAAKDGNAVQLLIPVVKGDHARARFTWESVEQVLSLDWAEDGKLVMAFGTTTPFKRSMQRPELEYLRENKPDRGDPLAPPTCAEGQVAGGAMVRCAAGCSAEKPCAKGHCEPWPGGSFCAVP